MLVGVDGSRDRVSIYNAGSFEHVLNPLSAFTSMQDSVFDNKDLGGFTRVEGEGYVWWLNEMRRMLRL